MCILEVTTETEARFVLSRPGERHEVTGRAARIATAQPGNYTLRVEIEGRSPFEETVEMHGRQSFQLR